MARFLKKEAKKFGTAPGSLIFVGTKRTEEIRIEAIRYDIEKCEVFECTDVVSAIDLVNSTTITWINIVGLHDPDIIQKLGTAFEIHPLLQEDILNTEQRPKFDSYESHLAFFLKMLKLNTAATTVESEQVSIIIGKNYLLSFQEAPGDVFDNVRERLIRPTTKIRYRGTDYLAFALMDAIVDHYILAVEHVGNEIETLTEAMMNSLDRSFIGKMNRFKREITTFRRTIRPVIELSNLFEKSESPLVSPQTVPFIKDLEDHTIHAAEAVEIYKEILNDELNIFHMNMTNRLNDILRVLTIFSVVFIPLTFIAGIYGTNFEHFPELEYRYAYPVFWGVLIFIAAGMLFFFYKKKWL